jgi:hypothetical protein
VHKQDPRDRAIPAAVIVVWYGGPDIGSDTVLACEPIPLASLQPSV